MRKTSLCFVPLLLAACNREPIGPTTMDRAAQPNFTLVARDDSTAKGGYVSWEDGQLFHWIFVSETFVPRSGAQVWLSYGAYDVVTYDLAFYGEGFVSPDAVGGSGQGTLRLRVDVDLAKYPSFLLFNHPGGLIEVIWQAVPRTAWRWHDVGELDLGPLVGKYNWASTTRDAAVEGDLAGSAIPSAATGWLWMNASHFMLLEAGH